MIYNSNEENIFVNNSLNLSLKKERLWNYSLSFITPCLERI